MATKETPATGDRYYQSLVARCIYRVSSGDCGPVVEYFDPKRTCVVECNDITETPERLRAAREEITHAEARAILGDKWPASWPQGDTPATDPLPWKVRHTGTGEIMAAFRYSDTAIAYRERGGTCGGWPSSVLEVVNPTPPPEAP